MKPGNGSDTAEFTLPPPPARVLPPADISARVHVDLAALSHQGKVRENNEDHFLVSRAERSLQTVTTNLPQGAVPPCFAEVGYGMLVADGMGGHQAGEIASRLAISTFVNLLLHTPEWYMRVGKQEAERVMERIAERYRIVDAVVREKAQTDPALAGMGTTMTLALSLGPILVLAHVGDSRVYLLRAGQCHQLTRDHTMAQSLVDQGILRPDQEGWHYFKHALTRVIGRGESLAETEIQQLTLADEDQILLCTDGLTDMVGQQMIAPILSDSKTSEEACQRLVAAALDNGGKDNVTVVLARYRLPIGGLGAKDPGQNQSRREVEP
jgi:serine/threonine protein phosphatase PrpC